MPMISREELDRLMRMAKNYINPPEPRTGHQTTALYDELNEAVMRNLKGLLEAADRGVGALMRRDGRGSSLMSNPLGEIADEIERLQLLCDQYARENAVDRQEIERLRAALKRIVAEADSDDGRRK